MCIRDSIYGINTGFGSLYGQKISNDDLGQLQRNLVMSHACGLGDEVPCELVRLILLLKIQSLSYGNSGVNQSTVERLIDMYNNRVLPVIYEQGSLGASGDLAPLAHMSLPLLGLGEVDVPIVGKNGYYKRKNSSKVLKEFGWSVLNLEAKEGLALLKQLRENNISSELYPTDDKIKKQMNYANKKGVQFVVMIGEDEIKSGELTIKDMRSGDQSKIKVSELINFLSSDENL